jgi:hypothetical protein
MLPRSDAGRGLRNRLRDLFVSRILVVGHVFAPPLASSRSEALPAATPTLLAGGLGWRGVGRRARVVGAACREQHG